jgi:hypothetical protein
MPEGFEQVIQSITRKEIKQRMRAAKDADVVEEFSASVGDVLTGVIQQGRDATLVYVDLGRVEGKIPPNEQVPTETYVHGQRIKCFVVDVKQGLKGPEVTLSRTHPSTFSKSTIYFRSSRIKRSDCRNRWRLSRSWLSKQSFGQIASCRRKP